MPSALAFCLSILAAAGPAGEPSSAAPEPTLSQAQDAAARAAAGDAADDASRAARARLSHWAPQLRGQALLRQDQRSRSGELRLGPVHDQIAGEGQAFSVVLAWDFSQVVYAREEGQLALAHAQLSRARREAASRAAQLFVDRRLAAEAWRASPEGPARVAACLDLLQLTAQLDALTAGLFRDALSREEAACAARERPSPAAGASARPGQPEEER